MKPSNISQVVEIILQKFLEVDDIYSFGNWRSIENFESYYINSKGTHVFRINAKDSLGRKLADKQIKIFPSNKEKGSDSYLRWGYGDVHRTVAETFLENWDPNLCVNHIDGNKWNNNVDNLEMCTVAENNRHFWFSENCKDRREQTKILISNSHKGRKLPEKTRLKMIGRKPWNLGIPCRDTTKAKLSEINKGKLGTFKGKKHSEESKEKMRKATQGKFKNTIWINDGKINKRVNKEEYSQFYSDWNLGRI